MDTRLSCELLLTNAHVLTMNDQFTVHVPGSIAIDNGRILAVGDIAAAYAAGETVDCGGRVVMPGLVNAHTHAPMTLLRGLADDLRLDVWLMGYMMPVERELDRKSTRLNSSHANISYAVFCLKKKKNNKLQTVHHQHKQSADHYSR